MAKTFKNLDELMNYLQEQITDSLEKDVAEKSVELMKEHVETDVYDPYTPTQYVRRREHGGLLDDDNYLVESVEDGIAISNVTKDDGYATPFDPDRYVTPIVEKGTGYTWEHSEIYKKQPYPRPFVENTADELEKGKAKEFLKEALEKRLGKGNVID